MLCPACGRSHAGECDKMILLYNELDYQKQCGSKTGAAALEFALSEITNLKSQLEQKQADIERIGSVYDFAAKDAEIANLRAALQRIAEYGGVDKPGGATITLSAATALQMRVMARAALEA